MSPARHVPAAGGEGTTFVKPGACGGEVGGGIALVELPPGGVLEVPVGTAVARAVGAAVGFEPLPPFPPLPAPPVEPPEPLEPPRGVGEVDVPAPQPLKANAANASAKAAPETRFMFTPNPG
jgi:hypothetical protein